MHKLESWNKTIAMAISGLTQVARDPAPPRGERRVFQAPGSDQSKIRSKNAGSREQTVRLQEQKSSGSNAVAYKRRIKKEARRQNEKNAK